MASPTSDNPENPSLVSDEPTISADKLEVKAKMNVSLGHLMTPFPCEPGCVYCTRAKATREPARRVDPDVREQRTYDGDVKYFGEWLWCDHFSDLEIRSPRHQRRENGSIRRRPSDVHAELFLPRSKRVRSRQNALGTSLMPGIRQWSTAIARRKFPDMPCMTCRVQNPDIPRSGRGAQHRSGAGQDGTPTEQFAQETSAPRTSQGIKDTLPERFPRTANNHLNLICRVQNPNIPRAGRVGAHGEAAGRGRAGLGANRTVCPGDKRPSYLPRHRGHVA